MSYTEYLKSKEWYKKREAICRLCGQLRNLNVHHVSYENIHTPAEMNDLIVLCKECHDRIHTMPLEESEALMTFNLTDLMQAKANAEHRYGITPTGSKPMPFEHILAYTALSNRINKLKKEQGQMLLLLTERSTHTTSRSSWKKFGQNEQRING